jgi:molybdopterin-guanine dinucleotide biosynthesis protein A
MNAVARFDGVVLAAGRSTRMGRDKALLGVDGIPLWQRQRDVLAGAGAAEIFLSARPDQEWVRHAVGFTAVLHDAQPNCGPMVGIAAALERTVCGHVAVLAIDLPAMKPEWFAELFACCPPGVGIVGRRGEFFEPLAAIYPSELKWRAWEALARSDYSLQRLIAAGVEQDLLRVREIGANEQVWFTNWNLPGGELKVEG